MDTEMMEKCNSGEVVTDADQSDRHGPYGEERTIPPPRSYMLVPMSFEGIFVGAICCEMISSRRLWSEDDMTAVTMLSEFVGSSIRQRHLELEFWKKEIILRNHFQSLPLPAYIWEANFGSQDDIDVIDGISCHHCFHQEHPEVEADINIDPSEFILRSFNEAGIELFCQSGLTAVTGMKASVAFSQDAHLEFLSLLHESWKVKKTVFRKIIAPHPASDGHMETADEDGDGNGDSFSPGSPSVNCHIYNVTCVPLCNIHCAMYIEDITDHHRTVESLERVEKRQRVYLQHAPLGIIIVNKKGILVEANQFACSLLGHEDENDIIGQMITTAMPDWDKKKCLALKKEIHANGKWTDTVTLSQPNGTNIVIRTQVVALENGSKYLGYLLDITEEDRMRRIAEESERKYRMYSDHSPEALVVVDASHQVIDVNPAASRVLGYTREELLRLKLEEFTPPDEVLDYKKNLQNIMDHGFASYEVNRLRKDGSLVPVRVHAVRVSDNLMLGFLQDLTQQKQMQRTLAENEEKYRSYIEYAPQALLVLDSNGYIIDTNEAALKLFGFDRDELIGMNPMKTFEGSIGEDMEEKYARIQEKRCVSYESMRPRKDGTYFPARVTASYTPDNRLLVFYTDITEEKKMTEALEISEKKYRKYIENAPDGVIVIDQSEHVIDGNTMLLKMLGYTHDELIHLAFDEIIPHYALDACREKLHAVFRGEKVYIESDHLKKDGETIPLRVHAIQMLDGNCLAFLADMTEQRKMQQDLIDSELKYRTYVDNTPDALVVVRKDGIVIDVNAATTKMFQYSREEIIGQDYSILSSEYLDESLRKKVTDSLTGDHLVMEKMRTRKDGSSFPARISASILEDGRALVLYSDLTKEKNMQREIQRSEEKYRSYVQNAPDCIFVLNASGMILEVNETTTIAFKYAKDELIGKSFVDVFVPDSEKKLKSSNLEMMMRGKHVSFEMEGITKDGCTLTVLVSSVGFSTDQVIAFLVDISEEKRIQNALEESERRHRMYVENAPDGIVIFGSDGTIHDVNPAACRLYEYTRDELLGMSIWSLMELDSKFLFNELNDVGYVDHEVLYTAKDGSKRIMNLSSVRLSRDRFMSFVMDITEQRLSQEALAESEKRFHDIFAFSADGIVICDEFSKIKVVNPATCRMFGCKETELVGSLIDKFLTQKRSSIIETGRRSHYSIQHTNIIALTAQDLTLHLELRGLHMLSDGDDGDDGDAVGGRDDDSDQTRRLDIDVRSSPIHFMGKTHYLLSLRDVTQARNAERERSRHLSSLQQAEELANLGYFENNVLSGETFWSSGFLRILHIPESSMSELQQKYREELERTRDDGKGGSEGDVIGLIPFVHPEHLDQVRNWITTCIHSPHKSTNEFKLLLPDGSIVEIQGVIDVSFPSEHEKETDEDEEKRHGESTGYDEYEEEESIIIRGVIEDITEKKKSERALQASERRYRQFVDNATEGIVLLNEHFECFDINEAASKLLGMSASSLQNVCFLDIVSEDAREEMLKELSHLTTSGNIATETSLLINDAIASESESEGAIGIVGATLNTNTSIVDEDSTIPVLVSGLKLAADCFLLFLYDLKDKRHAEEEKRNLELRLHESQKMEAIGRLAGGVAHDFNNLLTSILGNIDLAQRDIDPSHDVQAQLTEVREAAERAADLTRQLLAFSRKQMIQPRPLDLNVLVSKMLGILERTIGEDILLTFIPSKRPCCMCGDPGQMEQILLNLVVNARDAMPQGGSVEITTKRITFHQEHKSASSSEGYLPAGPYACLRLKDNGCGMDKETLSNIFEPFFTTKPEGKGTGLGLATVYGITQQHHGSIEVRSKVGHGSVFSLYFPRVSSGSVASIVDTKPAAEESIPMGSEIILLVEDDMVVQKIACKSLRRQGYTVHTANDGLDALALVKRMNLCPDLLLTDVVMPNMNGSVLAAALKQMHPTTKVIFTSGYAEDIIAHHGVIDSDVQFLSKPYTPPVLCKKVRNVLDAKG
eukprot:TRINITY_DN624_c0_g1_i1.p1 TRINITY_DN624_c0_g1~~TRINITY_DN624_c0_g1_i1.p1  ORF type:complete len:2303 (+),score=643.72 TRINITY_DN624_c0_g1_i1:953-6910(+)